VKKGITLAGVPTWLLLLVAVLVISFIAGIGIILLNGIAPNIYENYVAYRERKLEEANAQKSEQEERPASPSPTPESAPPSPEPSIIVAEDTNIIFFTQLMEKYVNNGILRFNYTWHWDSEFNYEDPAPILADFLSRKDVNITVNIEYSFDDNDFLIPEEQAILIVDDIFEQYGYTDNNMSVTIAEIFYRSSLHIYIDNENQFISYLANAVDGTNTLVLQYEADYRFS
jgi:hypothetical protein